MPGILLLTHDHELQTSIHQVLDSSKITIVDSLERAEEAAMAGRCAILIIDEALTHMARADSGERLRRHDPAMVTIVVGLRGQDSELIALLSAGAADRIMLKPLTPALSRIVVESAAREYQSRRARYVGRQSQPPPRGVTSCDETPVTQPDCETTFPIHSIAESPLDRLTSAEAVLDTSTTSNSSGFARVIAAVSVVALAIAVAGWFWWIVSQQSTSPREIQEPPSTAADRWLDEAGRSIDQSRFADAVNALQGARNAGASDDRIATLEARLRHALVRKMSVAPVRAANEGHNGPPAASLSKRVTTSPPASSLRPVRPAEIPTENKTAASAAVVQPDVHRTPQPDVPRVAQIESDMATHGPHASAPEHRSPDELRDASIQPELRPTSGISGVEAPMPDAQAPAAPDTASTPAPASERKVVRMIRPQYPSEARVRGIEGWADVSFFVDSAGDVVDPRVENSSMRQLFARPALLAVKQWKYEPAVTPAASMERVRIRVEFRVHE